jgi:hypothetical protein
MNARDGTNRKSLEDDSGTSWDRDGIRSLSFNPLRLRVVLKEKSKLDLNDAGGFNA